MKKKTNSRKVIIGLVIALAAIAILLVVVNILEESDFQFGSNDTANEANGYNEPPRLVYVGNTEMYEILNDTSDEGSFVYIGRPTCPHCVEFEPTLEETLEYLGQELRYFQIDLAREEDDESEMTMAEIMDELGVTGVPRIVYIENGLVIDSLSGNQPKNNVISFFDDNGGLN